MMISLWLCQKHAKAECIVAEWARFGSQLVAKAE